MAGMLSINVLSLIVWFYEHGHLSVKKIILTRVSQNPSVG